MVIIRYYVVLLLSIYRARGQDDLLLPNERTTLDDCHLRFHKIPKVWLPAPAFAHPARLKEFAHMGAIGWTQPDGEISWKCGGTLIWYNYVLTAAHCVIDSDNQAPDVVRLGDLNIESSEGDEYAQQLKIVAIFRHPKHRFAAHYHDIALLKLEKNITLTEVVAPACLWTDEEVRFGTMEATGWGRTGYAEDQTPILLKVALKPIDNVECSKVYTNGTDRKLRLGLQPHQICAVDEKMDTCEGDSGGPLQIKLMHNSRVTPFVVAITSFGTACGMSAPGVYTRIAPYHDWIVETMQRSGTLIPDNVYNATFCALRYAHFREYEDAISSHSGSYVSVVSERRHIFIRHGLPSYIVELAWNGETNDCYGVIIDENTVLTLAQCVTKNGIPVSHIKYLNEIEMTVSRVHIHPEYQQGSSYNNIAILRLQHFLNFRDLDPACIWQGEVPSEEIFVHGSGRRDINTFIRWIGESIVSIDPSISILTPRVRFHNTSTCIISKRHLPLLHKGLTEEHICNGQNLFLVPKSCDLVAGGAVHSTVRRENNFYPMVYGLNYLGRDCGFGEHSIAVGMPGHAEWMKSVLFPNYKKPHGTVQFVDPDRQEGDSCFRNDGRAARCVPVQKCSRGWSQFLANGTIELCATSTSVCCPLNEITNIEMNMIHASLAGCPRVVGRFNTTSSERSLVFISFTSDVNDFGCLGTIITEKIVLTSASCIGNEVPAIVKLAANTTQMIYRVDSILVHDAYNATDGTNDIVIIRLQDTLTWSSEIFPSCLWTNTTHVPVVLSMISSVGSGNMESDQVLAMYNSDCQRTHKYELQHSQLCARDPSSKSTCTTVNNQLRYDSFDGVPYVVGLSTDFVSCEHSRYNIFTRISEFVHWIGMNI